MAKLWYVFSERVRAETGKRLIRTFLHLPSAFALSALLSVHTAWTDSLPSYSLEIQNPSPQYQVGDQITLQLKELSGPVGFQFSPNPGDTGDVKNLFDSGWQIMKSTGAPQDQPGDPARLTIAPVKSGNLQLPSLMILDAQGKEIGKTEPLTVSVESAIQTKDPKAQQAEDLEPPVGLRFPWWIIVAAGIALALLIGFIIYFAKKWSSAKREPTSPIAYQAPPRPEDIEAIEALELLSQGGFLAKGQHKLHYFKLSEILKRYIDRRYQFDALERTSQEIFKYVHETSILSHSWSNRLKDLFERLDLVKFTDFVPTSADGMRAIEEAREFVLQTRKIIQPEVQPNANE